MDQRPKSRGRGSPLIVNRPCAWAHAVETQPPDKEQPSDGDLPLQGQYLIMQRSLLHMVSLISKQKPSPGEAWNPEASNVWHAIWRRSQKIDFQLSCLADIDMHSCSWPRLVVALRLQAGKLQAQAKSAAEQARAVRKAALAARLADPKTGKAEAFKLLAPPPPRRLAFLDDDGTLANDPSRIDQIAREKWGSIYAGNVDVETQTRWQHAEAFATSYEPFLFKAPAFTISPISTAQAFRAFTRARATAPGPDMWSIKELRLISWKAAGYLADLYGMIERGCPWPEQCCMAKASFMAKTIQDSTNISTSECSL